jgi:phosphoribosyl 1,2-cyclic phosphodiesterase
MRVVSLGSGSSGNAFLIEAGPQGRTRLLIDAGLSARTLVTRLASVGVLPTQLQGILVTHEHSDHVQGIPTLVKRFALPVIADTRTLQAIEEGMLIGNWTSDSGRRVSTKMKDLPPSASALATTMDMAMVSTVQNATFARLELPLGSCRMVGDIEVTSFPISHDAVAPSGYLLRAGGCRVCLVTDSGEVTPLMLENIQHADLLILESNHDRERLLHGPYPWYLKRRILGSGGHLSNDQAAEAVLRTWREDGMRWLWLAHLSRTNNTPALAVETMRSYLQAAHANLSHIRISALPHTIGNSWDSKYLLMQS